MDKHKIPMQVILSIIIVFLTAVIVCREPVVEIETVETIKYVYIYVDTPVVETPPEPKPEPLEIPLTYGFTEDDIYLMTVLLCGSARTDGDGEYDFDFGNQNNHDQISLVLSVVMNRVMSDKFPNTVEDVIWGKNQFALMPKWKNNLPEVKPESYDVVRKWCEQYDKGDFSVMSIPTTHLYFSGNGKVNKSSTSWR